MSFDLGVLSAVRQLDADEARDAYERLAGGAKWSEVLQRDDRIAQFVRALSARWPDIDREASPAHVILTMPFSAPDAVIEFCLATAEGLGLNVFDPQDGTLYTPGREPRQAKPRPQKALVCEHCGQPIELGTPYAEFPRLLCMKCMFEQLP